LLPASDVQLLVMDEWMAKHADISDMWKHLTAFIIL